MTIKELDIISEDKLQWDNNYTYKNFLEEGCRAICNYVFPVGEESDVSADDFEYFLDEDSKMISVMKTAILYGASGLTLRFLKITTKMYLGKTLQMLV